MTSALDTIVGANVISLLKKLGEETGISFVFISHDLSTVSSFADKIVVLYAGRLVEQGTVQEILSPPFHPYTKLLINSVPELRVGWLEETLKKQSTEVGISSTVEMTDIGCPFYNRCHIKIEGLCNTTSAPLTLSLSGHEIACHHSDKALLE